MQYLESSVKSGGTKILTEKQVFYIKWFVIISYTITVSVTLIFYEMLTERILKHTMNALWAERFGKILKDVYISWSIIELMNTTVSLFGILKIDNTVKELIKVDPKLKTNHHL